MFTILHFRSIIDAIVFYLVFGLIVGIPAFYFYKKAVATRKVYKCTSCGEIYKTEHMDSSCCKVCGAPTIEVREARTDD